MGATIASVAVFIVVFFTGLCGLLGAWGGYITSETDPNLYLLSVLPGVLNADQQVANWLGVLIILLIATMNSSAVDSFQNGMAATIASYLFKNWKHSMIWTRVAVFLSNVPIIAVATKGYSVNELYVFGGMLCSTMSVPLNLGLIDWLHPYAGGVSMLASALLSFFLTSVFGVKWFYKQDRFFDPDSPVYRPDWSRSVSDGMHYTWLGNNFGWQFFAMTVGSSTGSFLLFASFNWLWKHFGLRPFNIPGFIAESTHPEFFGHGKVDGNGIELAMDDGKDDKSSPSQDQPMPQN